MTDRLSNILVGGLLIATIGGVGIVAGMGLGNSSAAQRDAEDALIAAEAAAARAEQAVGRSGTLEERINNSIERDARQDDLVVITRSEIDGLRIEVDAISRLLRSAQAESARARQTAADAKAKASVSQSDIQRAQTDALRAVQETAKIREEIEESPLRIVPEGRAEQPEPGPAVEVPVQPEVKEPEVVVPAAPVVVEQEKTP